MGALCVEAAQDSDTAERFASAPLSVDISPDSTACYKQLHCCKDASCGTYFPALDHAARSLSLLCAVA